MTKVRIEVLSQTTVAQNQRPSLNHLRRKKKRRSAPYLLRDSRHSYTQLSPFPEQFLRAH